MAIRVENMKDLNENFLKYDTRYFSSITHEKEYYPLDFKKGIVIFIFSHRVHCVNCELETKMWTTIRRWHNMKEKYYRNLIGKEVKIIIENNKKE
jgi:hypothetical protein